MTGHIHIRKYIGNWLTTNKYLVFYYSNNVFLQKKTGISIGNNANKNKWKGSYEMVHVVFL